MRKIYAMILSGVIFCSTSAFVGCSDMADSEISEMMEKPEVLAMSDAIHNVSDYNGSYTVRTLTDGEEYIWMYNADTGVSFYLRKEGEEENYVYTTPMANGGYKQYINMFTGSSMFSNIAEDKAVIEFENREDFEANKYQTSVVGFTQKYDLQSVNEVLNLRFLIDLDNAPQEITEESMKAFWLEGIKKNADAMTSVFGMKFEYACNHVKITTENDSIHFSFDVDCDATTMGSFMGMAISECDMDATFSVLIQNKKILQIESEIDMKMVAGNITSSPRVVDVMDFTYSYDESLAPTIEDLQALEDSVTKTE